MRVAGAEWWPGLLLWPPVAPGVAMVTTCAAGGRGAVTPTTGPVSWPYQLTWLFQIHYDDVIMSAMASQITSLTIVYSTVYPGADHNKHQSSASLAFVWGIHRGPVDSPHKWPVTRKMFPFDDVIMYILIVTDISCIVCLVFRIICN